MCETALGAAILIHHSFEGSDKLSYGCLFQGKVSIRAPARGATAQVQNLTKFWAFQFALPRGERLFRYGHEILAEVFQFALPRGERRWERDVALLNTGFQFALPRGERRDLLRRRCRPGHGFNSRSREGSDYRDLLAYAAARVSIRAPARGATIDRRRHRQGNDVSIRAPARGATEGHAFLDGVIKCFNSRSREGSDPSVRVCLVALGSFNSRSREGSDRLAATTRTHYLVSIRAPARGATCAAPPHRRRHGVSIRAPARGATYA